MTSVTARSLLSHSPSDRREDDDGRDPAKTVRPCGGAPILDLALCLILAVTVVGLLLLAL